jgi:poly-gamma-glutamate capsule biosynthesis protein CapA/YwtB (metallophosphatase superfamily)
LISLNKENGRLWQWFPRLDLLRSREKVAEFMAEAQGFDTVPLERGSTQPEPAPPIRLFLCGDVMIGRGIDQVLGHPCDPALHESYVHSATDYVGLAEVANGPIPRHVDPSYVWGAALDEWRRAPPDGRIVNLETSVTRSDDYIPKGINYRVSPDNAACLNAAAIDCCVLANNHVLDWGHAGLTETLATLAHLGIKTAGAGRNIDEAAAPAVLDFRRKGRVLVFSFACPSCGVSRSWAATDELPGINVLGDLSPAGVTHIAEEIERARQPGDAILVSIHWGPNWGYEVPEAERRFAQALIDDAGVSIVHGHSSHHAKGIEVYRNRLILYGCGDFLNDYEGIRGYEAYRDDLALMYFASIDAASADVVSLEIVPLQIRNFRLARPSRRDVEWLQQALDRESRRFGPRVVLDETGRLVLSWPLHCNR